MDDGASDDPAVLRRRGQTCHVRWPALILGAPNSCWARNDTVAYVEVAKGTLQLQLFARTTTKEGLRQIQADI